jgi:deoxyribonuclease V
MRVHKLHEWQVSVPEAMQIQMSLARKIITKGDKLNPRLIAGIDISSPDAQGIARGAIVVLTYPEFTVLEVQVSEGKIAFPYIPGLLSFRESPLVLSAGERLRHTPDLVLVDGQGIAHPRRFGLASHLGLLFDLPTVGCAKSLLCGGHAPVGEEAGCYAELRDRGEVIGAALRTKTGMKPIYVSIGHKIDLATAIQWVMRCCQGYRVPEPTRLAHLAAAGKLSLESGFQGKLFV